ncbi:pre-mRNA splicing factor component-domain-containing protein [Gongronella butleri]|nr:pre-mRNA splicing factor component-domain-containing protein [Gongronella butleri]
MIKGGIWKNTEDEILKAAVSKYGKNQWARISSLLVRKSPKQCKARWYEWLDPSIKKTEWTKDEDEKLLHLAKLMPTQWRTIAPIVGRTPAQCLERYQRLLDEAEQSLGKDALGLTGQMGGESGPSADDVRRLRPGEVDPEPETKPARPDPVDMDEDEKEMLSEARARLANTQGKKAKRKARERQLEEARRLTALQKRRELKAAGINVRMKKLKNTMDYNTDIPFEKRAPKGFYDVTEEKAAKPNAELLTNVRLSKLNRRRADIEEEKERERKRKERDGGAGGNKSEGNQGRFVPAKEQARQVKIQEQDQIAKRRKLVLPAPQVGEQELEEIVKSGFAGESAKNLVHAADDDQQATSGLLGDYAVTPSANATRTPRVAQQKDTLLNEAMNLRALTATQTPLLGGDNVDLLGSQGTGFEGITPRSMAVATPNPMATPMRGGQGGASGAPGAQTPFKTPMRDHFNINDEPEMVGATPRDERMAAVQRKRNLLQGLASLPTPRNEWEIRLPDMDEKDEKDDVAVDSGTSQSVEDMAEVERREKERAAAEEEERLGRRSLAVQLGLPRPASIPQSIEKVHQHLDEVQTLIHAEFVRLLQHDAIKYPVTGATIAPGAKKMANDLQGLEDEFDRASLDDARNELDLEVKQMLNLDANDTKDTVKMAVWQHVQAVPGYEDRWNAEHDDLFFSSNLKQFMTLDELPDAKDKINGLQKMIESNRQTMIRDATKAGKLEKKLDVRLGGYMARSGALTQQIADAFEELESAQLEYNSFLTLQVIERAATPRRIAALEDEVHRLAQTERELQQKYRDLDLEKTTHLEALS